MNLIRNLIGLIITITLLPICIQAFIYTSNIDFNYDEVNDELALYQLRQQLLIAYDMDVKNNIISFEYRNNVCSLSLVNRKLLLQPGTQIYLNDIDDLCFSIKNDCVFINYSRGNKKYERILCKQERFYIDDFSDCDVLTDEYNTSEE